MKHLTHGKFTDKKIIQGISMYRFSYKTYLTTYNVYMYQ